MRELLGGLSACLGLLISVGTLLTVTIPALRHKLKEKLFQQEHSDEELRAVRTLLEKMERREEERNKEAELQKEVDLCVLRDLITTLYYRRLGEKKLYRYELEDVSSLYELYQKRGGNSYVHGLYKQMSRDWDVMK